MQRKQADCAEGRRATDFVSPRRQPDLSDAMSTAGGALPAALRPGINPRNVPRRQGAQLRRRVIARAGGDQTAELSRRRCLASVAGGALGALIVDGAARAAILEADDDVELLEKVRQDRKKRLERQGIINSSARETGYLQELVYKLSLVGQAIEGNDFSAAGSILGTGKDAEWVKNANAAFAKLSISSEEKDEVDAFNSSLGSLIVSVANGEAENSKEAFVTSASALEKWVILTGLTGKISGL